MAKTDPVQVICDAGPIIHLDQLAALDLLNGFGSILIPQAVWAEIIRHRPGLDIASIQAAEIVHSTTQPSPKLVSVAAAFSLDIGERAGLLLSESHAVRLFLTDDAAARLAAESLGIEVHGTLGVLLRAIRMNYRSRQQVLELLTQIPERSTMYISRTLLDTVIARVKDDHSK